MSYFPMNITIEILFLNEFQIFFLMEEIGFNIFFVLMDLVVGST